MSIVTELKEPRFSHWKFVLPWLIALALVTLITLILLQAAGVIGLLPYVGKAPPEARGPLVSAAAGAVAGYIGLLTFCINFHQKRWQHLSDANVQRGISDEQTRHLRLNNEFDNISREFIALCSDFSHSDLRKNVNAAINLARIARTRDPRVAIPASSDEQLTHLGNNQSQTAFPWFASVSMQLAAALLLYTEDEALRAVRKSIDVLRVFASYTFPGDSCEFNEAIQTLNQPLLRILIASLADSNRSSRDSYREMIAECAAAGLFEENARNAYCRTVVHFCDASPRTEGLLRTAKLDDVRSRILRHKDSRAVRGRPENGRYDVDTLVRFGVESKRVLNTKSALLSALRSCTPFTSHDLRLSGLILEGSKIEGQWLSKVQISDSDCASCEFRESTFGDTTFIGCDFRSSTFSRGDLTNVTFLNCMLDNTTWQGINNEDVKILDCTTHNMDLGGNTSGVTIGST